MYIKLYIEYAQLNITEKECPDLFLFAFLVYCRRLCAFLDVWCCFSLDLELLCSSQLSLLGQVLNLKKHKQWLIYTIPQITSLWIQMQKSGVWPKSSFRTESLASLVSEERKSNCLNHHKEEVSVWKRFSFYCDVQTFLLYHAPQTILEGLTLASPKTM